MPVVLIHGIDNLFGAYLARALSTEAHVRLIGLGRRMPLVPVGRAEVLVAELSSGQLVELLRAEQVDTLIHVDFLGDEVLAPDREIAVQRNVLGTIEVLGACATARVRRVVVRSSTLVYGAAMQNPAFIREEYPIAQTSVLPAWLRDYSELDAFAGEFASKHPDMAMLVLRCAPLLGNGIASPLSRYLAQSYPVMLLGFDPRIQVLHTEDAVAAFTLAVTNETTGCCNLAASDPIKLSQAIRLTGRQPVPILEPFLDRAERSARRRKITGIWPSGRDFLRYHCVADIQRAQSELGWEPMHSAEATLQALAKDRPPDKRTQAEIALQSFLARKG